MPRHTLLAVKLRDFIHARGALMKVGALSAFYRKNPSAQAEVGPAKVFCNEHRMQLAFEVHDGVDFIRSVPAEKGARMIVVEQQKQSKANAALFDALEPATLATLLSGFVAARGGTMHSSRLKDFYSSHPGAQGALCGGGGLRAVCDAHPQMLRLQGDELSLGTGYGASSGSSSALRNVTTSSSSSGNTAADDIARLLSAVVMAQGGTAQAGPCLALFYKEHPEAKAVIGRPAAFCAQYPRLLRYEPNTGSGALHAVMSSHPQRSRRVAAQPAAAQPSGDAPASDMVAKQLSRFVAERGGSMHAGSGLVEFFKDHPEAKVVIGKLSGFCERYPASLRFEANRVIAVPAEAQRAMVQHAPPQSEQPVETSDDASERAEVARQLASFVAEQGGSISAGGCFSEFYKKHPGAKAVVGLAHEFCKRHPDVLRVEEREGKRFITVQSTPTGPERAPGMDSADANSATAKDAKAAAKAALCRDVALRWKEHLDDGRQHLIGADRETMKKEYDLFLASEGLKNSDAGFGLVMGALQKLGFKEHGTWRTCPAQEPVAATSPQAEEAVAASDAGLEPAQVARQLACFIAESGGSMIAGRLGAFYQKHPEAKSVVGRVQDFCIQHSDALRYEWDGGCGVITVQSTPTGAERAPGVESAEAAKAALHRDVALRWKGHLDDGRQHLIGADRETLKQEYDLFLASEGLTKNDAAFGYVMVALQKLGFKEHGTWRTCDTQAGGGATLPTESTECEPEMATGGLGQPGANGRDLPARPARDPWANGKDPWSAFVADAPSVLPGGSPPGTAAKCSGSAARSAPSTGTDSMHPPSPRAKSPARTTPAPDIAETGAPPEPSCALDARLTSHRDVNVPAAAPASQVHAQPSPEACALSWPSGHAPGIGTSDRRGGGGQEFSSSSACAVVASMHQVNQSLTASIARLDAWERRLAAKEATLTAREKALSAREALLDVHLVVERLTTECKESARRAAEAAAAEDALASEFDLDTLE